MTAKTRANISVALITAVCGCAGVLIGAGMAWGSLNQRVTRLENDTNALVPVMMRIDRAMASVEQCIQDLTRRMERIEAKP